jgi:hypothetical protein
VGLVLDVDDRTLGEATHAPEEELPVALDELRPPGEVRVRPLDGAVIKGQDVVLDCLDEPEALQVAEALRVLRSDVVDLGPVRRRVVQLPHVVVEGPQVRYRELPRDAVARHGCPPLVVDPAVAEHLEVLRLAAFVRATVVEGVPHADAFDGALLDAVDEHGFRQPRRLQDRRCHVDDVVELRSDLAAAVDAVRPVDDGTVARATEVRGHLLGPLVRGVHRVRPPDGVVVVRLRPAEVGDLGRQKLRGLQVAEPGQRHVLIECALQRPLRRRAVVAHDRVDERVVEDLQIL